MNGSPADAEPRFLSNTALAHGLYWAVTGFWPLVSIDTFQLVTGPKRDLWLVKTAGALIGVIGVVLMLAGARHRITPEIGMLGAGSAATLACVDIVYTRRRVIGPIYLLESFVEITLTALWIFGMAARRRYRPA